MANWSLHNVGYVNDSGAARAASTAKEDMASLCSPLGLGRCYDGGCRGQLVNKRHAKIGRLRRFVWTFFKVQNTMH